MIIDFTQPVEKMPDGSYKVTLENGWPYNVLEADPSCQWQNLWPDIQAWLAAGNTAQPYVPPAPVPPTAVQQAQATIAAIQAKLINAQVVGPNAVSLGLTAADIANWKAAQVVLAGVSS